MSITAAAFEAIKATMPLSGVGLSASAPRAAAISSRWRSPPPEKLRAQLVLCIRLSYTSNRRG
jgi:hypothetical protein